VDGIQYSVHRALRGGGGEWLVLDTIANFDGLERLMVGWCKFKLVQTRVESAWFQSTRL